MSALALDGTRASFSVRKGMKGDFDAGLVPIGELSAVAVRGGGEEDAEVVHGRGLNLPRPLRRRRSFSESG
jgi:hypothetical protein